MKAIAKTYAVPDAAVQAIAAGCDAVLICSGNVEVQAATLEALVYAVENGVIPYKRLEDALTRLRRAKERFLASPVTRGSAVPPRHVPGRREPRRVAPRM